MAKRMFPSGIEVESPLNDFDGDIRLTQAALRHHRPDFEIIGAANGRYARGDILDPVGSDEWDNH